MYHHLSHLPQVGELSVWMRNSLYGWQVLILKYHLSRVNFGLAYQRLKALLTTNNYKIIYFRHSIGRNSFGLENSRQL
jgi:hypothetical protein